MTKLARFAAPFAAAALLAGCASTYTSPVEVNRFVGQQPQLLGSGAIALQPAPGADSRSPEYAIYEAAVAAELRELGYAVVAGSAPQIAEVGIERFVDRPQRGRSPVSVGVGGSTGSYGSGVGMGIGIDLSGPPPEQIGTEMRVVIRPASGGLALWEGRANFRATANSPYAEPQAGAARLADALFGGFPGRSGETIEVE